MHYKLFPLNTNPTTPTHVEYPAWAWADYSFSTTSTDNALIPHISKTQPADKYIQYR